MTGDTGAAGLPPSSTVTLFLPVGAGVTVPITLHPDLIASENRHAVSVLGGRGSVLLISDVYASSGGAGDEQYLRLVDTATSEERWWLLAESATLGWRAREPLIAPMEGGAGFTVALAGRPDVTVTLGESGAPTIT